MKAETLLSIAVLALVASTAMASDIDRRLLQRADIVVLPQAAKKAPTALQRIIQACGDHAQHDVPFSQEELDWLVAFGAQSADNTARVCKAFHNRRST